MLAIISILAAIAAIIIAFRRAELAAAAAGLAMIGAFFGTDAMTAGTLWFWLVALAIAAGITVMLPDEVRGSSAGVAYLVTAAAAGGILSIAIWQSVAAIAAGAVVGAAIGALAFGATPAGKALAFPSSQYFNYALAKGLPAAAIVAAAAVAIVYCI